MTKKFLQPFLSLFSVILAAILFNTLCLNSKQLPDPYPFKTGSVWPAQRCLHLGRSKPRSKTHCFFGPFCGLSLQVFLFPA